MTERFLAVFAIDTGSLRLPDFNPTDIWYLVYFLLFVIAGLVYLQWRLRKRNALNALSNRFMQILMKRDLNKTQLKAANDFFASLTEAQKSEIFLSTKTFSYYLNHYLQAHAELSAHDRTEIFDKMLLRTDDHVEIKAVADLKVGELCALDSNGLSHLTTVMKMKENMVLVSSSERLGLNIGQVAQLYAYRPHLGGFLLSGEILKTDGRSAVFKHTGAVEFKGDQHLMTVVSLAFKIERWPHPDADVETVEEAHSDGSLFDGLTDKISDRALIVRFNENPPQWMLKRQEFWELTLDLPEKPVICRVKILSYKPNDLWLLRLVDLDQAERARLYKFITQNAPTRERF